MESMVVKLKKDILLGILFLNGLVENGLAEESTAASIVSGLLSTASGIVAKNDEASAAVQQPNSSQVGEPQSIIPEQSDSMLNAPSESSSPENTTVSDISSLGIQNETSQFGVNDSSVNSERGSENLSKKVGFIDKDGNVFVPPESTIFPAEMQDGKIYFFSKDVYALKEKLKKNIKTPAPNTLNNPMNPLSNMTTAGNGETPGANMMGNAPNALGGPPNQNNPMNPLSNTTTAGNVETPGANMMGNAPNALGGSPNQNNPMNPLSNMTTAGNGETPGANMMGNAPNALGGPPNQNNPMNPLSNMTTAGNGETPGANMMGNANEKNRNESGKKPIMFQCYLA